ncbi:MAG TPA: alpha-E domain-containing protein, partial [Polyangiales bacterium]
ACSASEGFVKKNQGRVSGQAMVEFVLFEPTFPRSLLYCLRTSSELVRRIWSKNESVGRASMTRLEGLVSWLEAQIDEFDLANIHTVLTRVVDDTASVCSHIQQEIQGPVAPVAEPAAESDGAAVKDSDGAAVKSGSQVQAQG